MKDLWLVTEYGRERARLSSGKLAAFRRRALRIAMYYVGSGEAIVVSRGGRGILVDGGADSSLVTNDPLGQALAAQVTKDGIRLVAVVASHPHQDHTNAYRALVVDHHEIFAEGALYFDNATVFAESNWERLKKWQPNLPFELRPIRDDKGEDARDLLPAFDRDADAHFLRSTTSVKKPDSESVKYWSAFLFLRFRDAWMLFTGDAYKGYEDQLYPRLKDLSARAHLLKVTHHGSSDGTSPKLVLGLRPAIAIVSSAADKGHQLEKDVRERLAISEVYATYEGNGPGHDILVRTDGRTRGQGDHAGILFEVETRLSAISR